jgi:DNA-binding MarR family transcriptional regulator
MLTSATPEQSSTLTPTGETGSDYVKRDSEPLWPLIDITRFAISRLREMELAQFGLTIEQSSILKILASLGGSSTLGELEYITMRQPHTLSTIIKRMTGLALVGKKRPQTEKRHIIYITGKGKTLLGRVTENSVMEVFSCLSVQQMAEFVRLFEILRTKSRDLLRIPFLEYIIRDVPGVYTGRLEPWHVITSETTWTILDSTRFLIARLREMELAQFGFTIEQLMVLKGLVENNGSLNTRSLEETTLRQHHSISVLVNRMIRMGLLTKTRKEGENRNTIFITKKGEEQLNAITEFSIEVTFSALKTREKQQIAQYLHSLNDKARVMLGKPWTQSSREDRL